MTNQNCLEGIKCPNCGNESEFRIEATAVAIVTDGGADIMGDLQWDEKSFAHCPNCERDGSLADFYEKPNRAESAQSSPGSSSQTVTASVGQLNDAARDVLNERQRQMEKEGWTTSHDDEHSDDSLSLASICYAAPVEIRALGRMPCGCREASCYHWQGSIEAWLNPWPWDEKWWKPKSRRENLVRAAALLLAEIERLDRAGSTVRIMPGGPVTHPVNPVTADEAMVERVARAIRETPEAAGEFVEHMQVTPSLPYDMAEAFARAAIAAMSLGEAA